MEEANGVFLMPCAINGLKLKFIYDTGASTVSLSMAEAIFMLKNGYLNGEDIIGTQYFQIADGNLKEGTRINLRYIEIGNLKIKNVEASIVHNLDAPLLLGQTALSRLGKIEFDYSNNTLTIIDVAHETSNQNSEYSTKNDVVYNDKLKNEISIKEETIVFISTPKDINELLYNHFKASGQEKLMAAQSFYIKAKVSQMGMDLPMEMKIKKPEKFYISIDLQGQKIIQAFDGVKGWMINPMVGAEPVELAGDQLAQARQQVDMEGELYNFEAKGHTAELAGKVNVDGKEMYRIKLTTKDGTTKDYFIDTKTNLVSKVKSKVSAQGQTVDVEQIMSDYKTIEGITMSMKIESKSPMGTAVILMEEVKINEPIDDSIFKQPAK